MMLNVWVFFCLISIGRNEAQPPPPKYAWTGFRLSQQWPADYCKLNSGVCDKPNLVSDFTIHGLWPYQGAGKSNKNCKGSPFTIGFYKNIAVDLNNDWRNFKLGESNKKFWEHEWNKHGVCSESLLPGLDYFKTALKFKQSFDILGTLQAAGIFPNDGQYQVQDIEKAISQQLKVDAEVHCKDNGKGQWLLFEIRLCIDQLARAFVSCPKRSSPVCGGVPTVIFIDIKSA